MSLIEFKKITHNLSDESFDKIKRITESYISYYFVGIEETDKNLYLEKIGEYFKNFENHNKKIRDNDIAQMYVSELASLMKNRAKPGTRAEDYLNRITEIENTISNADVDKLISLMEDATKLFVCFYNCFIENGFPVCTPYFFAEVVDYSRLAKSFLLDKPEDGKDKKAFLNKVDSLIPTKVKNMANDINEKAKETKEVVEQKLAKKVDTIYEPFHNQIEYDETNDRYTKRAASFILLSIMYFRIVDLEEGRTE